MNEEVRSYIEKQSSPQKEILERVRGIFFKTIPNCDEKIAWGVVTFSRKRFYMAALKERVHVGFSINGLNKEEIAEFEGSGKTMRHMKIKGVKDIDKGQLARLIKLVDKKAFCISD